MLAPWTVLWFFATLDPINVYQMGKDAHMFQDNVLNNSLLTVETLRFSGV
jgi:hypothetical protein